MIRFKDFPIKVLEPRTWKSSSKGENVSETLLRLNIWIEENEHIVLNIETLMFPELDDNVSGTGAHVYQGSAEIGETEYYQVFRVWHQENSPIKSTDID